MSTEETPRTIGSDAWLGAGNYEPGSAWNTRATDFFKVVKWGAVAAIASRLRGGISCSFADKFAIGNFNIVRRLDFDDGVSWVARVRLPPIIDGVADRGALPVSQAIEMEAASIKFLRLKTSIPIPEVHAYDSSPDNEVGSPFILMDYIHGTVASELRELQGSAYGLFGTPEQDRKFRDQMARIQAIVASLQFPKIGCLYYNKDKDDFFIGKDLETGQGPWSSSTDYYDALTSYLLKSVSEDYLRESTSFMLPSILNYLLRIQGEEQDGPFRLTNRDFGAHNILVNGDFDIVGVIDFDGVMAAPLEVVAQYPDSSFLDVEPPGVVETRPLALERIASTLPKLESFKEMLAKWEGAEAGEVKVADRLGSTSACAYQEKSFNRHYTMENVKEQVNQLKYNVGCKKCGAKVKNGMKCGKCGAQN
ncbi:Protein kinase-like domain protein [Cordyceps fumosorosea ARSEF 2679]|uniref:Protein kinase-like domain protein n=1 Tax=Cordyceps fumosorosea (strain ARSEF 2679) TaxID=1081104 RepID=A0A168BVM4_CORFA|nr:Protein kinase-like domain protein [Cordyceps fumosorosea ARSEF 2679]OAA70601.1 Protein kinase-like domain protein [Cordyceps fumosorosea ARSEF 2679]